MATGRMSWRVIYLHRQGAFKLLQKLQEHRVSCESQLADIRTFAIILRWKVDIFCALACLFQVLFRWANQQEDEREVCGNFAAISRAAQTIYLYLYLSISMSIYLLGEGNLHRTQLTWLVRCWGGQAEGKSSKETRWVHHSCWTDCRWVCLKIICL